MARTPPCNGGMGVAGAPTNGEAPYWPRSRPRRRPPLRAQRQAHQAQAPRPVLGRHRPPDLTPVRHCRRSGCKPRPRTGPTVCSTSVACSGLGCPRRNSACSLWAWHANPGRIQPATSSSGAERPRRALRPLRAPRHNLQSRRRSAPADRGRSRRVSGRRTPAA
jgi:hypothetical protein